MVSEGPEKLGVIESCLQNGSKLLECLLPGSRGCLSVLSCQFLTIFEFYDQIFIYFTLLIEDNEVAISEFSQVCSSNHISCNNKIAFVQTITIMALFVSCFFVNVLYN